VEYLVKLSDRAVRDLAGIHDFVEADTSEGAYAWFLELEKALYSLERHPERGGADPHRKRHRRLFFGTRPGVYKIIYEIDRRKAVVKVFHIRHGARA
jgi:toxin ParE1/3/4